MKRFVMLTVLALAARPVHAIAGGLTPLGDLPNGAFESLAYAVSADGTTVVGRGNSAAGYEAFRWTAAGGVVDLGDLPGGQVFAVATGVSADGSVVAGIGSRDPGSAPVAGFEAFRWTAADGMVGLNAGGNFDSQAAGVSGDGLTIVGYSTGAFRWTAADGMVGLAANGAYDVNGDGSVIVGQRNINEAFRWTPGGGVVGLTDLPGGASNSSAAGVSADGSVVVGQGTSAFGTEAFRWTSAGGMAPLGDLPGGTFDSVANAVSTDGLTVVGTGHTDAGAEAFQWTADAGIERLWDVLLGNGIDPAADGWSKLEEAQGVSADGKTIVGWGTRNGFTEAFVAVVPEPSGLAPIAVCAAGVLARRRRRIAN